MLVMADLTVECWTQCSAAGGCPPWASPSPCHKTAVNLKYWRPFRRISSWPWPQGVHVKKDCHDSFCATCQIPWKYTEFASCFDRFSTNYTKGPIINYYPYVIICSLTSQFVTSLSSKFVQILESNSNRLRSFDVPWLHEPARAVTVTPSPIVTPCYL